MSAVAALVAVSALRHRQLVGRLRRLGFVVSAVAAAEEFWRLVVGLGDWSLVWWFRCWRCFQWFLRW